MVNLYAQAALHTQGPNLAGLPVQQQTKCLPVINPRTPEAFGLIFPPDMLNLVGEVIE